MTTNAIGSHIQSGKTTRRLLLAVSVLLYAAGVASGMMHAAPLIAITLRWLGFALFLPVALRRRSLLLWTFFAIAAGAELGMDAPHFAAQTHFLGDIFLRLIRMIVAPLIFGGIVTGIAGHGELRGVGRVAVKSIVYFEIITTLGLIIGLVAMNISHAGEGITLPAVIENRVTATGQPGNPPHQESWQQLIVNIVPENIAQ